ncbi:protein transport protein SEC16A homolog isoform X2 [Arabidopsis lyrata subsp. lyrata]|uniref:protein transport protein SEC16A homolog isoform X2 n=1 Tax=Arabidopsis lyrata subsp. lyrata TaxID=81972 RepID=UPI000A29D20D|nr:protein transport protein SEC16A homolog isoform X2 [Arabidopsis lyrata subsp. lyrata]|eukprot:XP_020866847.1 protein transport protein SEC16A homolog isoform X2 [Arabidopsis lyrata subsp. lyrata]
MASTADFLLEDQTDEDFFDKLVDDSYTPTASSSAKELKFDDGSDSDDARAFANLSVVDDVVGDGDVALNEAGFGNDVANEGTSGSVGKEEPSSSIAPEALQFVNSDANKLRDDDDVVRSGVDDMPLTETAKESNIVDGSGSPGVKEVGWGSFYADSSVNDGRGFGSYSDFFTELDGTAGDLQGQAEVAVATGGNLVANATSVGLDNSAGFEQHHGQVHHDSGSGQYVDNSQSWENLYPGWKYDASTGQWYQVDGHDASVNSQESYTNSTSNWESVAADISDVAYLKQSTTSAAAGTAESVSTWNQVSQVGNGYPEHMVFDAQYPGWYYDTIAQEWRSLDSYNQASQTTVTGQAHDQQVQNGHAHTATYHSNSQSSMYDVNDKNQSFKAQEYAMQSQHGSWDQSYYANNQQAANTWQSVNVGQAEPAINSNSLSSFRGNQHVNNLYSTEPVAEQFKPNAIGAQSFIPQHMNVATVTQNGPLSFSNGVYNRQQSVDDAHQSFQNNQLFSPSAGRSSDGRPPHALVSFGFGGKLILMKDINGSLQNSSFGSQGIGGSSASVLNLAEVISGSSSYSSQGEDSLSYFRCLHQQSLPGPLVGGNVGSKELHKWIDERILNCESSYMDFSRGKLLKMLLSLLRISCQYYGKLRSPFGTDASQKETDSAEAAVAKLFAFAKKDGLQNGYAPISQCLQHLPPESQMQVTASEVQNLLASGRKMEALQCAQEGHLWGIALIIAAQLGDQFYVDTVKQMALRQLIPGSPLRTLCLLVAGQPAEVCPAGSSSMLDNWEENLGIITANRTTDDELVITHLGDRMWKDRGEIIAAHICYLIADKNFDPYSESARLCLVGADHWKCPRTYASPEAIQRTELYEYSKTLGNSQYILLPFQPYKIIYAHMLAEVGKLSTALKYCQAVLKCLKTGRSPEVEMWKQFVSSLEERIRIHQQGGYTANMAPAKLVGKFLNFIDTTASRVVGGMPPPAPHPTTGNLQVNDYQHQQQEAAKLSYSQSANTMSSLMPPASSIEPVRELGGNGRTMAVHSRSVSEPDFGRTPIQTDSSKDKAADEVTQVKATRSVPSSRFSRFGIGILKRVLPSRSAKEAKLGDENQFYYDDNLKRWVERGVEPPAEEAALPPPPTLGAFRSNSLGYENKSDMKNEMSPSSGSWSSGSPTPSENSSGIPPVSQGSNQFSARGRMGVRARYVDTFNQGRGNSSSMYQSPPVQSAKPPIPAKAKFFVPAAPALFANDQVMESVSDETRQENSADEGVVGSAGAPGPSQSSFQSPTPSPMAMQRFPSLDNIKRSGSGISLNGDLPPSGSRRTASWSGSVNSSSFMSPTSASTFKPSPLNSSSSSLGEELQEVEL